MMWGRKPKIELLTETGKGNMRLPLSLFYVNENLGIFFKIQPATSMMFWGCFGGNLGEKKTYYIINCKAVNSSLIT